MKVLITSMPICMSENKRDFISMRVAPTTAIYLLAAVVREKGYDIELLDPYDIQIGSEDLGFEEVIKNKLKMIDVVCLSSNTLNWANTVFAIRTIRRLFGDSIKIVVGGLHATYFYKHVIKNIEVDFVLRGEGEITLPMLIDAIDKKRGFENIEGLISKNYNVSKINLIVPIIDNDTYRDIPLPAFDLMPDKVYNVLPIETSRGCLFNCAFCSVPHRNLWRGFDENLVVTRSEEIIKKYLHKFKTKQIFITDDCLTANFERANNIMGRLVQLEELMFTIETRATDWLKGDTNRAIEVFSSSNIVRFGFGVECGYNEGLKKISKGLTIELLEQTIELLENNNMLNKAFFSFIIGFPWETMDDCIKTVDFAAGLERRCGNRGNVNVNWLQIYPSDIWESREKYGIRAQEDIFDDTFFVEEKYYELFHPILSISERDYIKKCINRYEDIGTYLRNF